MPMVSLKLMAGAARRMVVVGEPMFMARIFLKKDDLEPTTIHNSRGKWERNSS